MLNKIPKTSSQIQNKSPRKSPWAHMKRINAGKQMLKPWLLWGSKILVPRSSEAAVQALVCSKRRTVNETLHIRLGLYRTNSHLVKDWPSLALEDNEGISLSQPGFHIKGKYCLRICNHSLFSRIQGSNTPTQFRKPEQRNYQDAKEKDQQIFLGGMCSLTRLYRVLSIKPSQA